jgi:hypothetical protein
LKARIILSGSMCVGKSHLATLAKCQAVGLSDPIEELLKVFFSTTDKKQTGLRKFMQTVGQWGRGVVSAEYPLNIERATFTNQLRDKFWRDRNFPKDHWMAKMPWADFGTPDFWVTIALLRARSIEGSVAIPNIRFRNELQAFLKDGWKHFHVLASETTWHARLALQGVRPDSAVLRDVSEQFAVKLNEAARREGSQPGSKMAIVWNEATPGPARFLSLSEFLKEVAA